MPDDTTRAELARLRATVAALAAQHATTAAEVAALRRLVARPRRRRAPLAALGLALLVALVPAALLAATPFTDLVPGSVHNANIAAISQAGVTTGCVPAPDPHPQYCPTTDVTREEMASFLARLGGLGSNPPVARALTAQSAASATTAGHASTADTATTAVDAATVGGYAPSALLRVAQREVAPIGTGLPFTERLTVPLTAPAPGFVLVTATATLGGLGVCPCAVAARLRRVGGPASPVMFGAVSTAANAPLVLAYAFPVAAGPHTFALDLRSDPAGVGTANGHMTALYVPFGADGGTTLDVP